MKFSLRYHLVALVVVVLVPALMFAGFVVGSLGREQQRSVERGLQETVRALAIAVEREIAASVTALEVLAASTAIDRNDLASFHRQATRVLDVNRSWYIIGLTDPDGQILLSTEHPFGPRLPWIGDRAYIREVVASSLPAVSDLIAGRITGRLAISVAVPVTRDGALRYTLFAALTPESLGRILAAQRIPPDWIAAIADREHVIVARNRRAEAYVGRPLIEPVRRAIRAAPSGSGRYPVFDGPEVYSAWQRTASPGWTVTLGAPVTTVDVPLRRSVSRLMLGGGVVSLVAAVLAVVLGRRISGSMSRLASSAAKLARGASQPPPSSNVLEVHAVGQALEAAGRTIGQRTAELESSQARLKRLVDSTLIGVAIGEGQRITEANDAFLRMVGYSREDLCRGALRSPALTPPEHDAPDAAARELARRTGACPPYETEYVRKDGARVEVLAGLVLLDEARDEWAAFALDLTDRNRLQAERALRIEAEMANRAKDEFLAMVSHELRTPLAGVSMGVEVLRRAVDAQSPLAAPVEHIARSARLQARLINDLLDASRIVTGKLRVDRSRVLLGPIVTAAVSTLRPDADDKGVEIRITFDASPAPVCGDPERLQQIALNLIGNAIKFTPPGGRVEIGLDRRADSVVFSVRDTGRGIPPELMPHIFDRFRQGPGHGRHGGLGLGLAIVRHLVEAHEGTVRAESLGVDRGSVFTVEIPVDPQSGSATEYRTCD